MNVRIATISGIFCFAGFLQIASAVIPGPGYEYGYDASTGLLPNDPALSQPSWNYFFGAPEYTSTSSVSGGALTVAAPSEQYLIYRMNGGTPGADGQSFNPDLSIGSTIQFSAQITSGVNNVQAMTVFTPTNQFIFSFGVTEISTFTFGAPATATYANTGGYHTYQINLNTDNSASVYVDGVFGFTTLGSEAAGTSRLEFGNGYSLLNGGTVNYQYVQWTNAGVLPVPEPTTVVTVLRAMGLLLGQRLVRKRRSSESAAPAV